MASINPYIHFNGNAEEAFTFYKSVFGGDFTTLVRFKDLNIENTHGMEKEAEKIMHITLPIGKYSELMGSDTPEQMGRHNEKETRSKIYINTESKEEVDTLFKRLSMGGQIEVPLQENSEDACFGMFRDQFGIEWIISFNSKK